ncbi:ATP-binding protein [Vibrio profundum]|uniref:ATP-binding protein n=1 Tax=Vibrio profundum TaxID=2910247 RepID=UPI003D09ADA6
MTLTLTLVRGLPGSGKTTLAKTYSADHFEADMYFVNDDGEYQFDATRLKQAHSWCQHSAKQSLQQGRSVVVSNTFVRLWEMKPYLKMAQRYNAEIEVIECQGRYANTHGVSQATVNAMKKRWQILSEATYKGAN